MALAAVAMCRGAAFRPLSAAAVLADDQSHGAFVDSTVGIAPGFELFSLFSGAYLGDARSRVFSVLVSIAALATAMIILYRKRENRETAWFLILWFGVPIILLLALSLRQNLFLPRTLVYTTPALALLMGCALARAEKGIERCAGALMVVILVSANLFALRNYYISENPWVKSDLREGADEVAKDFRAGDVIIHSSQFSYRPFQYYLGDRSSSGCREAA